jgi:hypothetical protein
MGAYRSRRAEEAASTAARGGGGSSAPACGARRWGVRVWEGRRQPGGEGRVVFAGRGGPKPGEATRSGRTTGARGLGFGPVGKIYYSILFWRNLGRAVYAMLFIKLYQIF